ncbi:hypothetical protein [Kutzneria sp. CA-103260]|uniref:hypothetical protein n=1 Tax=Kutzneria sp. CA-103260 TaxID=2802641 RepID=UPI001BA4705B|nr:hypothetical protein [Kutzneria sp. CA-103260]QUQ65628.1 hypothetical protein JJ691_33520 [Kutzneria sp. CA-103260]
MDADRIVRVRYFDRQFLRPQDFTDEQSYHVAMRRRHDIAGHSWGIVHGLALGTATGALAVEPGLAVDGYGREVVVIQRMSVPALPPAPVTGETAYDVWLVYDRIGSDVAPAGYAACGADATAFYRWQELPRLIVSEADDAVDATHPPGVPDGDLAFGPERTAPEEDHPWPVLLGRVRRTGAAGSVTVDGSGRRYAGLVASSVAHPNGTVHLDLGPTAVGDQNRLALRGPGDLFDIAADGTTTTHGGLTVQGELRIDDGALSFPAASSAPVANPQPWQLYGTKEGDQRELRVELPPGKENSLVVGTWSDQNVFTPCLTVGGDNTVTVHGTLNVVGKIITSGAVQAQAADQATRSLTTGTMLSGFSSAAGVAARLYRPQSTSTAGAVAVALAADPDLLQEVANLLRQNFPPAATTLTQHLTAEG